MKNTPIILFTAFLALTISACKKKDDTPALPVIYVTGNTNPGPTLWKNGVQTILPDTSIYALSKAMYVSGTDVYQCGYAGSPLSKATYWKNGIPTYLTDGTTQAMALDICVSGSNVHVVGYQNTVNGNIAMYWKNGVPSALTTGTPGAQAISICISGSDVYILIQESGSAATAKYLKNGVETVLTDPSLAKLYATDMFVQGTDVYVSGYGDYNSIYTVAKYWKNGVRTNLGAAVYDSKASSVFVSGTDVYVAGFEGNGTYNMPTCWKNGVPFTVSDGTLNPFVDYVFVYGNDVYLAGHQGLKAKYWKNGVPVILGAYPSTVSGIVVK